MKKVVSLTRRAIEQYNMIEDGDKIAVGVSGGKDSLVLLNVLAELSRYYPKKFTVMGLTLWDMMPIIQKYKKCVMIWALNIRLRKQILKRLFLIYEKNPILAHCVQKCAAVR